MYKVYVHTEWPRMGRCRTRTHSSILQPIHGHSINGALLLKCIQTKNLMFSD